MRIRAYAALRDLTGLKSIDLPVEAGATVGDVLHRLAATYPALSDKLWDGAGARTGYVTVLLNGRSIDYLGGGATPVADGDEMDLFPPVGGGSGRIRGE